jgi:hypothetical protein
MTPAGLTGRSLEPSAALAATLFALTEGQVPTSTGFDVLWYTVLAVFRTARGAV